MTTTTRFIPRLAAISVTCLATAAGVFLGTPAATAATLTDASWSVSNNQVSAAGVTYVFNFTAATTGDIKTITMTLPPGTGGSAAFGDSTGLGAGTLSMDSDLLTYSIATPVSVSAGTAIQIGISGLTNVSVSGSYATVITTMSAVPAEIDSATSPDVAFAAVNTQVAVDLAQSTTFTSSTDNFKLAMDPALAALSTVTKDVVLSVRSNAGNGYTLAVNDSANGLKSGANRIDAAAGTAAAPAAWSGAGYFGYTAAATGGTLAGNFGGGSSYAGYTDDAATLMSAAGPTGNTAHTVTITNKVQVDYSTPAGDYTDAIVYTVTPSY